MRLRRPNAKPTTRQRLRNDELTAAPRTFSYGARRRGENEQPKPGRGNRGGFWLQRFGLVILLAAIIASAANVLNLSSSAKVLPLSTDVSRPFLRPISVYEKAAAGLLEDSLWNRNKVTVNTAEVSRQMLNQFPELTSVSITVPLLAHRPVIYIQPAQPALMLVAGNGSFVIDSSGKALGRGDSLAALRLPKLPVLNDQSGLHVSLNRQALAKPNVSFIQTVIAQLAARQITVSGMVLPPAASELNVQLEGQPYLVKFNLQSNTPREQSGTFLAAITDLKRRNIVPAKYVDVRVDGRAYYQ